MRTMPEPPDPPGDIEAALVPSLNPDPPPPPLPVFCFALSAGGVDGFAGYPPGPAPTDALPAPA